MRRKIVIPEEANVVTLERAERSKSVLAPKQKKKSTYQKANEVPAGQLLRSSCLILLPTLWSHGAHRVNVNHQLLFRGLAVLCHSLLLRNRLAKEDPICDIYSVLTSFVVIYIDKVTIAVNIDVSAA